MGIVWLCFAIGLFGLWLWNFIEEFRYTHNFWEALKETGIIFTIVTLFAVILDFSLFIESLRIVDYPIQNIETYEEHNGFYILGCGGESTEPRYKIYVKEDDGIECNKVDVDQCTIYPTKGEEHCRKSEYHTRLYLHQNTIDKLTK